MQDFQPNVTPKKEINRENETLLLQTNGLVIKKIELSINSEVSFSIYKLFLFSLLLPG